jgi:hypothetical protein
MYLINNRFGILKSQICMVGDRLDTDILFGQNGGCKTLLVLSGNYKLLWNSPPTFSMYIVCTLIEVFLSKRCDLIVDASKSKQLHQTRFLHQQNFWFSFPQSFSCLSMRGHCALYLGPCIIFSIIIFNITTWNFAKIRSCSNQIYLPTDVKFVRVGRADNEGYAQSFYINLPPDKGAFLFHWTSSVFTFMSASAV